MKKIKITLSKKIIVIFVTCILLPILFVSIYFYGNIKKLFYEGVNESLAYSVDMTAGHMEKLINDAEEIAVSIGIGERLQRGIQKEYQSYDEFYEFYNSPATVFLKEITTATQGINGVVVYTDNPTIFNSSIYANFSEKPQIFEWISGLKNKAETIGVISELEYENGIESSGILHPQITMFYRVPAINEEYRYDMVICVDLNMQQIYEWLKVGNEGIHYCLVNEKGEIIASTDKKYETTEMDRFYTIDEIEKSAGEIRQSISFSGRLAGWELIGIAEEEMYVSDLNKITIISEGIIVLMLVLSAVILISLIRPYTSRLSILSKRMEDFSTKDLSLVVTKPYRDEVEIVIQNYNHIMSEMDILINEVYALNLQKQGLEINQMQAQMNQLINQVNPHFLFNTLNAILTISEKNEYTEVTWCIEHLALMMRKLLDWSRDKITVQEEIDFVQMYFDIEKLRFANRFDFQIEVDPMAKDCLIPKMSIQPLVENACKYGIHRDTGYGKVSVQVKMEGSFLCIYVLDTGTLLKDKEIANIKMNYSEENEGYHTGVGLKNVYSRLKLYYKEKAEMFIEIRENKNCFGFMIQMEEE